MKRWLVFFFVTLAICWDFFFFFQAEDGIRDIGVTGVQTCALPIYFEVSIEEHAEAYSVITVRGEVDLHTAPKVQYAIDRAAQTDGAVVVDMSGVAFRSEERRVGKECRSRWSPYH